MSFDDQPIGGNKFNATENNDADLDDLPIKKGAYNLDNLGDDAFGGGPPNGNKAIKAPPARFAAKPKPSQDSEMVDETADQPKKQVVSKIATI